MKEESMHNALRMNALENPMHEVDSLVSKVN